jgi:hypothetical protein
MVVLAVRGAKLSAPDGLVDVTLCIAVFRGDIPTAGACSA